MFDPWLTCCHPAITVLGDNLLAAHSDVAPPRKRRIKLRDRENLEATLRSILANLAHLIATGAAPPTLDVTLRSASRKLTRYDRRGLANLPRVLEVFSGPTTWTVRASRHKGIASAGTVAPGLRETLDRFRFGAEHFGIAPGREVICLSRTARDYLDDTKSTELIDYSDTPETVRYRAEVERINALLAGTDVRLVPDGGPLRWTSRGTPILDTGYHSARSGRTAAR